MTARNSPSLSALDTDIPIRSTSTASSDIESAVISRSVSSASSRGRLAPSEPITDPSLDTDMDAQTATDSSDLTAGSASSIGSSGVRSAFSKTNRSPSLPTSSVASDNLASILVPQPSSSPLDIIGNTKSPSAFSQPVSNNNNLTNTLSNPNKKPTKIISADTKRQSRPQAKQPSRPPSVLSDNSPPPPKSNKSSRPSTPLSPTDSETAIFFPSTNGNNKRPLSASRLSADSKQDKKKKKPNGNNNNNRPPVGLPIGQWGHPSDGELNRLVRQSFQAVIECGLPGTGKDGGSDDENSRTMVYYSEFFGGEVPVFLAEGDPQRRLLYKASDLAAKFHCANNMLAMYLNRRKRKKNSGIYQALGFKYKSVPRGSLKCGGYFVSIEACRDFEQHYIREHGAGNNTDSSHEKRSSKDHVPFSAGTRSPKSNSRPSHSSSASTALVPTVKPDPGAGGSDGSSLTSSNSMTPGGMRFASPLPMTRASAALAASLMQQKSKMTEPGLQSVSSTSDSTFGSPNSQIASYFANPAGFPNMLSPQTSTDSSMDFLGNLGAVAAMMGSPNTLTVSNRFANGLFSPMGAGNNTPVPISPGMFSTGNAPLPPMQLPTAPLYHPPPSTPMAYHPFMQLNNQARDEFLSKQPFSPRIFGIDSRTPSMTFNGPSPLTPHSSNNDLAYSTLLKDLGLSPFTPLPDASVPNLPTPMSSNLSNFLSFSGSNPNAAALAAAMFPQGSAQSPAMSPSGGAFNHFSSLLSPAPGFDFAKRMNPMMSSIPNLGNPVASPNPGANSLSNNAGNINGSAVGSVNSNTDSQRGAVGPFMSSGPASSPLGGFNAASLAHQGLSQAAIGELYAIYLAQVARGAVPGSLLPSPPSSSGGSLAADGFTNGAQQTVPPLGSTQS